MTDSQVKAEPVNPALREKWRKQLKKKAKKSKNGEFQPKSKGVQESDEEREMRRNKEIMKVKDDLCSGKEIRVSHILGHSHILSS